MNPLPHSDILHLQAANGWLELGNHLEANEELEEITPRFKAHPDVLKVKWQVFVKENRWEACLNIAQAIIKLIPGDSWAWVHRSFALHELKQTQEAYDLLLPAHDHFPGVWTIPYNLVCYCAQLGRLEEAQEWFKQAMAIDED